MNDKVTADEARALLVVANECSLLPWEMRDDGDDYVIDAPEAAVEIGRVHRNEGAEIDAAWIVRAVNAMPALARTVIAQGEEIERLTVERDDARKSASNMTAQRDAFVRTSVALAIDLDERGEEQ